MGIPQYVRASGIYYPRELDSLKRKKGSYLQPLFEAITNAWEAIMDKYGCDKMDAGEITIRFNVVKGLELGENTDYTIRNITIEDNGIGLDEVNLTRLKNLRDPSKNHINNGTGRVQYLFYFNTTTIESVSAAGNGKSRRVKVTLSMSDAFLRNNSIMRLEEDVEIDEQSTRTLVTLGTPLNDKEGKAYSVLTASMFKNDLVYHSLARFCDSREHLPKIIIERYVDQELVESQKIESKDILEPDKTEPLEVAYSTVRDKKIVRLDKTEHFTLRSFVVSEIKLDSNVLYMVSKGELGSTLPLDLLSKKESINGQRYMFLLSGSYLDELDSDDRGNIALIKESDFKKELAEDTNSLIEHEVILKEHLTTEVNTKIALVYQVFKEKEKEKEVKIQELQEMFLLDETAVDAVRSKIKKDTTDAEILKMVYEGEMEKVANVDASIKKAVKDVKALNPKSRDYQSELKRLVADFATKIPEQNKSSLTKYIARRKLVLELFDKILHNEIDSLRGGKRIDEDVLHNLIFRQHTTTPNNSDLWLLDDQYLYFKGSSDIELNLVKIDGEPLLKQKLSKEEEAYKLRQNKDVGDRRPDIMLFPSEGKCVLIELKAPNVDVSEHLDQINRYAMIIHNLSNPKFTFNTFYGYLIGENVDYDAIQENNVYFKQASNLGYIYRPNYPLPGKFGHIEGDLYTEVIKYSDLLKRAQDRNRIFIEILEGIESV